MRFRLALWLMTLVGGCNYNADVNVDGSFQFSLGSLDQTCSGSGSTDDQYGHTDWTKSSDGVTCHVTGSWSGNLVDMPALRDQVDQKLKDNGSSLDKADVSFKKVDLTFHDPVLSPALDVSMITLQLSLAADPLADQNAATVAALFDGTPIELPAKSVSAALDAFKKKTPLAASGSTAFDVALSSLPPTPQDGTLVIQLNTEVLAGLTIKRL